MTEKNVASIERNGSRMPVLGLGTWQNEGVLGLRAIREAIELGYRHIDTAQMYENEEIVGEAIRESGVERSELFVTTKLARGNLDETSVHRSCDDSLDRLRTDYVDLLLIHWPDDSVPLEETLGAMAALRDGGRVKNIGVSNFTADLMKRAVGATSVPIFCNQVEYHPYLDQGPVLSYCRDQDIPLVAYSPLAKGAVVEDERLAEIGNRHGKSPAQVGLRWLVRQPGVAAIPKGTRLDHVRENLEIFDFDLTEDEAEQIDSIEKDRRVIDPDWAPRWDS